MPDIKLVEVKDLKAGHQEASGVPAFTEQFKPTIVIKTTPPAATEPGQYADGSWMCPECLGDGCAACGGRGSTWRRPSPPPPLAEYTQVYARHATSPTSG